MSYLAYNTQFVTGILKFMYNYIFSEHLLCEVKVKRSTKQCMSYSDYDSTSDKDSGKVSSIV